MKIAAALLALNALAFGQQIPDQPITAKERVEWFASSTAGPASLLGGVFSAGFGTLTNRPPEYGTHWSGFAERYGMRLSGIATGNAIEAGVGAIWGEDPRYPRAGNRTPFGGRVGRIVKFTFLAPNGEGSARPAYARYLAVAGNNFLSNAWREPSEANTTHAGERIIFGFLGRMSGNAWEEFWPDAKRKLLHRE